MSRPYEDPDKAELREIVVVALDSAGFEVDSDPHAIALPGHFNLHGGLRGDIQSVDGEGSKAVYFLRVSGTAAVPQWISNLAPAAAELGIPIYIVAREPSPALEKSCQSVRVGLLKLTDDAQLVTVIDPNLQDTATIAGEVERRVKAARRRMEEALRRELDSLNDSRREVGRLTAGMDPAKRDDYIEDLDQAIEAWTEWSVEISQRLDEAVSFNDLDLLEFVERRIETGAGTELTPDL